MSKRFTNESNEGSDDVVVQQSGSACRVVDELGNCRENLVDEQERGALIGEKTWRVDNEDIEDIQVDNEENEDIEDCW